MKTIWPEQEKSSMKDPKISPEQEQLEKLKELGDRLREIRLERRLSLETAAQKTRIQVRLLQAIEEGRMEVLPEPIYIRGFIQQFANALGLDGEEFARDFPTDPIRWQSRSRSRYRFGWQLPSIQLRPIHLYLLYILLVICAVQFLSNLVKRSEVEVISQESIQQPILNPSPPPPAPAVRASTKPTLSAAKPVVVDIKVKDQCWLRVVVDGKTEFEGVLPQGTHRTWVANEQLTIRAGNAGGVIVAFNDQKAKQLGQPGQVQEVTFQANPRS